jgi:hypothetical protein
MGISKIAIPGLGLPESQIATHEQIEVGFALISGICEKQKDYRGVMYLLLLIPFSIVPYASLGTEEDKIILIIIL